MIKDVVKEDLENRLKHVMEQIHKMMDEKKKRSFLMKIKRTKPKTKPKGWN
ncbi:hypothetical protein ACHHV8_16440 [Paenibacillus sp. TAB 01]|uniref:hypothetical protein n=1 Tax=Paenibacillus sp. TAB 01 TaxID=3368988 RepID=UPI00375298E0